MNGSGVVGEYRLGISLLSDLTPGRGDGVAGLVDQEVVHDRDGFPYVHGRTIKGLLREECEALVDVLRDDTERARWATVSDGIFGRAGSTSDDTGRLHVDHALLPGALRRAVAAQLGETNSDLTAHEVLATLTAVRRQTAIDGRTGAPAPRSLRSSRVIVRDLVFEARLTVHDALSSDELAMLDAGVLALRRMGSGRNRGRGRVHCRLIAPNGQDISGQHASAFVAPNITWRDA